MLPTRRHLDALGVAPQPLEPVELPAGLARVDFIRAADFQSLNLLLSLRAGEPYRVARALAMEAALVALPGGSALQRAAGLVATTRANEVMLTAQIYDHDARLHSFEIAAEAAG